MSPKGLLQARFPGKSVALKLNETQVSAKFAVSIPILAQISEASSQGTSIFAPASPAGQSIVDLSILVLAISAFIFLVVEAILIYCLLRFRHKKNEVKQASGANHIEAEPPQVYGSQPIEIAWTAAPAVIVFFLVLVITRTLWEVKAALPEPHEGDNTLFVTVIGRQWWWEYRYEEYNGKKLGFTTANELHIPVSSDGQTRPVHLLLKSADVCHSFWVPRLNGKVDLIPGHDNHLMLQTNETGLFLGQCAEYCGTQHANMLLRVVVDTPEDFENWLKAEAKPAVEDATIADGKAMFMAQSCINCHRIRGTVAAGNYGPDLTHLMARQTLASGMIENTPENLRTWIHDPQTVKPGCLMPAFGLSRQEEELVLQYLLSLH